MFVTLFRDIFCFLLLFTVDNFLFCIQVKGSFLCFIDIGIKLRQTLKPLFDKQNNVLVLTFFS